MRIEQHYGGDQSIRVVLSERNLKALLTKLAMPGSFCTIYTDDGDDATFLRVYVSAEQDEEHYKGRTPGGMHPETEAAIREYDL